VSRVMDERMLIFYCCTQYCEFQTPLEWYLDRKEPIMKVLFQTSGVENWWKVLIQAHLQNHH